MFTYLFCIIFPLDWRVVEKFWKIWFFWLHDVHAPPLNTCDQLKLHLPTSENKKRRKASSSESRCQLKYRIGIADSLESIHYPDVFIYVQIMSSSYTEIPIGCSQSQYFLIIPTTYLHLVTNTYFQRLPCKANCHCSLDIWNGRIALRWSADRLSNQISPSKTVVASSKTRRYRTTEHRTQTDNWIIESNNEREFKSASSSLSLGYVIG